MNRPRMTGRALLGSTTLVCGVLAGAAFGGGETFESLNVDLLSHIPLNGFSSNPSTGNDCWGYVSPSGREYALMGLRNALAVVEITNPAAPVIIDEIGHTNCLWGDVKIYGDRAYVTTDCNGGMDILDLSDVDNGNVSSINVAPAGLTRSHNIAIDTASGYLYLSGSNLNNGRITILELSNPDNPTVVGQVSSGLGAYSHDAETVTYTSGPYAGKEICFSANGGTGLDIYDVTDKGAITRLSRTQYPGIAYSHHVSLSEDKQYLYLDDELDLVNETVIFDVSDLSSPVVAGTSSSTLDARDHNTYIHDGFVYEADYRSGLRIFCAENPASPVEVGWFDTFPADDAGGFDGAWSCYPYFPSGNVIISDECRGLFVVDVTDALVAGSVAFTYPNGLPTTLNPAGGTTVRVETAGICTGTAASGTAVLHYDDGSGLVSVPMSVVSDNVYDAVFGPVECAGDVTWYITAETTTGSTFSDPNSAPDNMYTATATTGTSPVFTDDFEADLGWSSTNAGAADGDWERGVPIDDAGYAYDPASDSDGSGQCWVTDNTPGDSDVDPGGFIILTSPPLDMSMPNLSLSYDYFVRLTVPSPADGIRVEITSDADAPTWFVLSSHNADGGLSWHHQSFTPDQLAATGVALTANTTVRFIGNDGAPESVVELGIDAFKVEELTCNAIPGDLDGDGIVGINDFLALLGAWGPCGAPCPPSCVADLDGDCTVGISDFLMLLANWT